MVLQLTDPLESIEEALFIVSSE